MEFVLVNREEGLSSLAVSGLVGMAPHGEHSDDILFIKQLKDRGLIDETVFSLSVAPGNKKSQITFGGYDLEKYAQKDA